MLKITPFLWFDGQAEEAARFYVSVFRRDSKIKKITRYGASGPGRKDSVMTVSFHLDGQEFVALNGGPAFKFTEAISLMVHCATQRDIDWFWKKLSKGGKEIQCGWLKDRYGLFWQITPVNFSKLIGDKDSARKDRVMKAMFEMVKLDKAALERAFAGPKNPGQAKKSKRRRPAAFPSSAARSTATRRARSVWEPSSLPTSAPPPRVPGRR